MQRILIRSWATLLLLAIAGCEAQPSNGGRGSLVAGSDIWTRAQYDGFHADCLDHLNTIQNKATRDFLIGSYERFDWNQDDGTLVFSDSGVTKVVAEVQFVGSFSTISNTWLWSWDNATILPQVKQRMFEVREFGERHGIEELSTAKWPATVHDGWAMTAITAKLLDAHGAYRTADGDGFTFLVMTSIRWANEE